MNEDLTTWLRAQLDDDERIARAAGASVGPVLGAMNWRLAEGGSDEGGRYWRITTLAPEDTVPTVELVGNGMSGGGVHEEALGRHIVAHDPARVLREIDAKRRIVRALESAEVSLRNTAPGTELHTLMTGAVNSWRAAVRMLAAAYDQRPGYKESWRP